MFLRIICKSRDKEQGYCEEVFDVKSVKPFALSLLKNPVEYTDKNGHVWNCEKEDIISDCSSINIVPAICNGVYKIHF